MDSSTDDMRYHAHMEGFKMESLNICIQMFKHMGRELPEEAKDYILEALENLATKYDIIKNYDIYTYKFKLDNDEEKTAFAKVSDVEEIFGDFRERLTTLVVQLVLFDLELFLAKEGYND